MKSLGKLELIIIIFQLFIDLRCASMAEWSKASDSSSVLRCRRGFEPHSRHSFIFVFMPQKIPEKNASSGVRTHAYIVEPNLSRPP